MLYSESPDANIGTVRIHDFDVPELLGKKLMPDVESRKAGKE